MLGCFHGQPPDPFWVGPVGAETFVCLTAELLSLLTQRDRQGVWILADHLASLNFDHLKDQEFALIKDLGQKRGSLYWLRGWEVFEQIKRPLLNSRGFCFLLPSRSALKIWGDGVSNDGG